jgi:hypothetical protein
MEVESGCTHCNAHWLTLTAESLLKNVLPGNSMALAM